MNPTKTILSSLSIGLIVLIFFSNIQGAYAQNRLYTPLNSKSPLNQKEINVNDTVSEYYQDTLQYRRKSICKSFTQGSLYRLLPQLKQPATKNQDPVIKTVVPPLLTIHGNVQYSFLYRSYIDTPYAQPDYQEHAIQANLNLTIRDRLPVKMNISTRVNNSTYFRDFFDLNLHYDKNMHLNKVKQRLYDQVNRSVPGHELSSLENKIKEELDKYRKYKFTTQEPGVLQKTIAAREKAFRDENKAKHRDTTHNARAGLDNLVINNPVEENKNLSNINGSFDSTLIAQAGEKDKFLDSLDQNIRSMMKRSDSLKNIAQAIKSVQRDKIYKATNINELNKVAEDIGQADTSSNKLEKVLMSFEKIGIGRSILDYSELTASNVLLTGVNVEYNNGIYAAVAAGKIDYGFRDFLGFGGRQRKQQLLIGRVGVGDKSKSGVIFSAFTGRKNLGISIPNDSLANQIPVIGYAVETFIKKSENTSIVAEVAKTSHPVSGSLMSVNQLKNLFNYADNSNLGISLKAKSAFSRTNTLFSGAFRRIGSKFQAFNLYANSTDQDSWNIQVDQSLLHNRIGITGTVRKNDFSNPYTEKDFKTTSVLGSIQTNIRFPRLPVLSAGYFPGTQIYVINEQRLKESAYYILNGSITHNYLLNDVRMVSSLLYNMYSSKGTDSGFIAYKGKMMMASHSLLFTRLQWQNTYAFTQQELMDFYSVESGIDYSFATHLSAGCKAKYNHVMSYENYLGHSAHIAVDIKGLGSLQFHYDKAYLPTIYKSLFPIQSGRAMWYKTF